MCFPALTVADQNRSWSPVLQYDILGSLSWKPILFQGEWPNRTVVLGKLLKQSNEDGVLEAILGRMVEHTLVTLVIFFALVLDNKVCQTGRSTEATYAARPAEHLQYQCTQVHATQGSLPKKGHTLILISDPFSNMVGFSFLNLNESVHRWSLLLSHPHFFHDGSCTPL